MTLDLDKSWAELSPAEKGDAIRPLIHTGESYSQIARQFGTTRLAVAGAASRHGIESPYKLLQQQESARKAREAKAPKPRHQGFYKYVALPVLPLTEKPTPMRAGAFEPLPGTHPVEIADHRDGCRWPVDVGERTLYCNAPAEAAYCATHAAMARRVLPPVVRKAKPQPTHEPRIFDADND